MASIAFEEYKNKLNNLRPALDDLGGALHLDEARNEVEKLEEESAQDGFWNDTENSQRVQKRIKTLQHKLDRYAKLSGAWEDMLTMCEMAIEEDDDSMLPDLESEFHSFEETLASTIWVMSLEPMEKPSNSWMNCRARMALEGSSDMRMILRPSSPLRRLCTVSR